MNPEIIKQTKNGKELKPDLRICIKKDEIGEIESKCKNNFKICSCSVYAGDIKSLNMYEPVYFRH